MSSLQPTTSELLDLANRFLDRGISQAEIVRVSFEIQVGIATRKRSAKGKHEKEFRNLADLLVEIVKELMERDDAKSLTIVNVVPSILNQVDPQQTRWPALIEIEANFERVFQLLHAIGELPLCSASAECLERRIVELLESERQNQSSLLNLATFLYETHRKDQWASLVRRIFNEIPQKETADCALFLKSRKACLRELATAICGCICQSQELLPIDLFLVMVLSSCECACIAKTLRRMAKQKMLHKCSLEYPVGAVNMLDIVDCFCCLCTTKESPSQIDEIARLLVEIFLKTENAEILTFALFNEDESKVLLEASIRALVLAAKQDPRLLDEKLDICAVLSIVSKHVMEQLIQPLCKATSEVPSLLDKMMMFLKKMVTRPAQTQLAIWCFKELIDGNQNPDFHREIMDFLFGQIDAPYLRSLIFRCLAQVNLQAETIREVKKIINDYPVSFDNLLETDGNGFVTLHDIPAATLAVSLKLGKDPGDYLDLVAMSLVNFDPETSLVLQLALRADVLCLLAPHSQDAFFIFSEFFRAIEAIANDNERGMIGEWCSLQLDRQFVLEELKRIDAKTDPLFCYSIIRQMGLEDTVDKRAIRACYKLFNVRKPQESSEYYPLCKRLRELPPAVFNENYIRFREEFIVLLAKHGTLTKKEVGDFHILDDMIAESLEFDLTSRHFGAYLSILETTMDVSSDSCSKLANILTVLSIEDRKMLQRIVMLVFSKAPERDAFAFAEEICDTFSKKKSPIIFRSKATRLAAVISVCLWLGSFAEVCEDIEGEFLACFEKVLSITYANKSLCAAILRMMERTVRALLKRKFGKAKQLRQLCETWFGQWRNFAGVKACGQCSARLHMFVNKDREDLESDKTAKKFVDRKWRSRVKWINEGLRDESDSDDNFADLEDFIVDETPPESEVAEEYSSDLQ